MLCARYYTFEVKTKQIGVVESYLDKKGIPYENITAQTSDGYVLTMQVLGPKDGEPVFVLHGMFESSAMTLAHGLESLPILLSKKGYKVYLGNVRGNMYGLKHATLSPWMNKFWDFSVRQHGMLDFPAMISTIKTSNKNKKITVIGQSQGALVSLMGLSATPSLNKSIKKVILLSPALVLRTPTNPLVNMVFKMNPAWLGDPLYFSFVAITQLFIPDFVANFFAFTALEASGMSLLPLDREGAGYVMASTPSGFLPCDGMRFYIELLEKGEVRERSEHASEARMCRQTAGRVRLF